MNDSTAMKYFEIELDWDAKLNSPWDALWHQLGVHDLNCLHGSYSLKHVWKSPVILRQKRKKTPNIFGFVLHWAVTSEIRQLLEPIVGIEAEFLPLAVDETPELFLVHPLLPVEFDDGAVLERSSPTSNVTVVRKYSFTFNPESFNGPRHLFRMLQPRDTPAGRHGATMNRLIVSEIIRDMLLDNGACGVRFNYVHSLAVCR